MYPTRVSSDEEEGPDDADSEYLSSQCVWEASSYFVTPLPKDPLSDIVAEVLQDSGEPQHTSDCLSVSFKSKLVPQNITKYLPTSVTNPV